MKCINCTLKKHWQKLFYIIHEPHAADILAMIAFYNISAKLWCNVVNIKTGRLYAQLDQPQRVRFEINEVEVYGLL